MESRRAFLKERTAHPLPMSRLAYSDSTKRAKIETSETLASTNGTPGSGRPWACGHKVLDFPDFLAYLSLPGPLIDQITTAKKQHDEKG
jgi:hypothetical protein